jgi:hypothetical protein
MERTMERLFACHGRNVEMFGFCADRLNSTRGLGVSSE